MGEWQRDEDGDRSGKDSREDGGWGSDSWSSAWGSSYDGNHDRGQWGQMEWMQQPRPMPFLVAPPPPPLPGNAYAEGYRTGYQEGFEAGLQQAHGQWLSSGQSQWDAHGGDIRKKKTKRQWRKYDAADERQRPLFKCQVGKGPDGVAVYPQVIQERLRAAMENVKDGEGAQEERYEMAEDGVMKIRLFTQEEYVEHWEEKLAKRVVSDNGDVVGAQRNMSTRRTARSTSSWREPCVASSNARVEKSGARNQAARAYALAARAAPRARRRNIMHAYTHSQAHQQAWQVHRRNHNHSCTSTRAIWFAPWQLEQGPMP